MKHTAEIIECVCLFAIIFIHKSSITTAIITVMITIVFGLCAFIEGMHTGEKGGRDEE